MDITNMKTLLSIFILIISFNSVVSSQDITGEWRNADEMSCPDFILLHEDGSYVIFNDCGSDHPWFPMNEKGSWKYDQQNEELEFTDRQFYSRGIFRNNYGIDDTLTFYVESQTENNLRLCFGDNRTECRRSNYSKVPARHESIYHTYSGGGSQDIELELSRQSPRSILTISKISFDGSGEIKILSQDGEMIYCTRVGDKKNDYEDINLFLADIPDIIYLEKVIFKIKTDKKESNWKFNAEISRN